MAIQFNRYYPGPHGTINVITTPITLADLEMRTAAAVYVAHDPVEDAVILANTGEELAILIRADVWNSADDCTHYQELMNLLRQYKVENSESRRTYYPNSYAYTYRPLSTLSFSKYRKI